MLAVAGLCFTACDDDDDDTTASDSGSDSTEETVDEAAEWRVEINDVFINTTVIPTYKALADASEELADLVSTFTASQTDDNLAAVGEQWKVARQYWEWSEAFLFGAATTYGIDPHIDTWPFDDTRFDKMIAACEAMDEESYQDYIDVIVAETESLTGFHALEYVIFEDGTTKTGTSLDEVECYFLESVAGDLYLSAVRLEAAWAGIDNVSSDRQELLEDAEMEPEDEFGDEFMNAGNAGSRWASSLLATVQIIEGALDIIDEVSASKIGAAYTGEDTDYIESPYSYNSITDFYDNILGCAYSLYGVGPCGSDFGEFSASTNSVMAYGATYAATETAAVESAFETALGKILDMAAPFVLNYTDSSCGDAMDALNDLADALTDLESAISE